jgi:hypothetical protein
VLAYSLKRTLDDNTRAVIAAHSVNDDPPHHG